MSSAPADDPCGAISTGRLGLRIGSIFAILVRRPSPSSSSFPSLSLSLLLTLPSPARTQLTSLAGTLFPILAKRVKTLERTVPGSVFDFSKCVLPLPPSLSLLALTPRRTCRFFGSGVILATGFIHLLQPATEALGASYTLSQGGCISDAWAEYPYAFAFCLVSLYATFVSQVVFLRIGTERVGRTMGRRGAAGAGEGAEVVRVQLERVTDAQTALLPELMASASPPGLDPEKAQAHGPSSASTPPQDSPTPPTPAVDPLEANPVVAQLMSAITLEFGVVLHSVRRARSPSLPSPSLPRIAEGSS